MWGSAALPMGMTSTHPGTPWCSTSTHRRVLEERRFPCSGELKNVDFQQVTVISGMVMELVEVHGI